MRRPVTITLRKVVSLVLKHFSALLILLLFAAFDASAQIRTTDGATPLGIAPGTPAGSYSLSGFDNVNLYNGNLNFNLPLLRVGGRGGAKTSMNLNIDSSLWTTERVATQGDMELYNGYDEGSHGQIIGSVGSWESVAPVHTWWGNRKPGYGPGVLILRRGGDGDSGTVQNPTGIYKHTLTRLTFITPDGTEYELRDTQTGGKPKQPGSTCGNPCGFNRGKVFVSADGTAVTFISDADIRDAHFRTVDELEQYDYPSGYLMLADGTRYRFDSGNMSWMRDRNGNKVELSYVNNRVTLIRDSLKREVTVTYAVFPSTPYDEIKFRGFNGEDRSIKIHYAFLNTLFRSQPSWGNRAGKYSELFPNLSGSNNNEHNVRVVSEVTLPDDRKYTFKYTPWGEVARVVMPTGGAIEYDYGNALGGLDDSAIHRRVTKRRLYPNALSATYETEQVYAAT